MGPINYTIEELISHKDNGVPEEALKELKKRADAILEEDILTVTARRLKAPSGNPHDYISMGIYWWPNPDTKDGLPYVNRDGYVNPDTQDKANIGTVGNRTQTLALATFYFGDKKYAEYAERQLYAWFLDPDTYMAPHGKYAQAIPGICDGRAAGIIDFANNSSLLDGIGILEAMGWINPSTVSGIKEWYVKFTDWLLTSNIGIQEDLAINNHGVWYDAQILTAAVFTDRPELVKKILTTSYRRRFLDLIEPDGSQPHELKRTKAMNYSLYSIRAYSVIANIGERLGYDCYWGVDPTRGRCLLKSAIDYVYGYVLAPDSYPYRELHPERVSTALADFMVMANKRYPNDGYLEKAAPYINKSAEIRLIPIR